MNNLRVITKRACLLQKIFELSIIQKFNCAPFSSLPFKIPEPIERSSTELLEALSETIGIDETASSYAFIDDPAMIPTSLNKKKHFFLCKVPYYNFNEIFLVITLSYTKFIIDIKK